VVKRTLTPDQIVFNTDRPLHNIAKGAAPGCYGEHFCGSVSIATAIKQVKEACYLLYETILIPQFTKSYGLIWWSQRDVLLLIRFFLLGYFQSLEPEAASRYPVSQTGCDKVDFLINGIAVEFAIRTLEGGSTEVSASSSMDALTKLMKHIGPAVLVVFDFSHAPYTSEQLESYRGLPSLGKGHHSKYPFSVLYYYKDKKGAPQVIRKNIRVDI
jgi:hypothetical protein